MTQHLLKWSWLLHCIERPGADLWVLDRSQKARAFRVSSHLSALSWELQSVAMTCCPWSCWVISRAWQGSCCPVHPVHLFATHSGFAVVVVQSTEHAGIHALVREEILRVTDLNEMPEDVSI